MSLIPTPPALAQALAAAQAAEKQAKAIDTSAAWRACADAWREVARLNREAMLNARYVRRECKVNPYRDQGNEHMERARHHHAAAIGWASR